MRKIQVGNRVKVARIEADLTQQELAEKASVTRQTIGLIESGKYNPTIQLCLLLAHILGKRLDELFWIIDSEEK